MLKRILRYFDIREEKEKPSIVIQNITDNVSFRGTNLWILIFAIFIASLGLNVNSTAVIIGAMLISPLMGPIMGIGMGAGINDLALVKRAARNFSFAVVVGLATSFIYFAITPLDDAYSELLARTSPTIYDVLIALFGGFAGIVAASSTKKGNVIPGVAIATALMPPLCTAGYGLATLNFNFFFGALYLFSINTVFIALATLITVRMLKYPVKHLADEKADMHSRRIITAITVLTLVPSIYFGMNMIQHNRFTRNANTFVEAYASVDGNYLLNKTIDPQNKSITLIYGGSGILQERITEMREKLALFNLKECTLTVKQGLSFLNDSKESSKLIQLTKTLEERDQQLRMINAAFDSIASKKMLAKQMTDELKTQYASIHDVLITYTSSIPDSISSQNPIIFIRSKSAFSRSQQNKIINWLKVRMQMEKVNVVFTR